MKKIQQFYILKLASDRIRDAKYNINLDLNTARKNGEVVSIGQNQVIKSLLKLKNKEFDQQKLNELFIEKKKLKKKDSSIENSERILSIENQIDDMLYIPELISIQMTNKLHYAKIATKGIIVNGFRYVRLLAGAGQVRLNTAIFIREDYEIPLKDILNNGRNMNIPMVYAKNNAYFALTYSNKIPVQEPYFCVIPDYEIKRMENVEFIDDDMNIEIVDKEIDFNIFDGMGIVSPQMAEKWSHEDLELDYIPSAYIIRCSFLKGSVCVFDFHKFSDECGIHIVKDVWGNFVNTRDMDVIITASQFKAWNQYSSCQDYIDNCHKNGMEWGVSRYTPKKDSDHIFTNYQFLQVLNLNVEQIHSLCSKTINYLNGIVLDNIDYSLLYSMGKMCNEDFDDKIYSKIGDVVTKCLILNNKLLQDPYVQNHFLHSLNKKIKESYIGNLLIDGNYTMIECDPYAFCEHMFSLPVKGLLERDEHYCGYWNKKGIKDVVAMRAPLTWRTESNKLNLKNTEEMNDWYRYLQDGVLIFNAHGNDSLKESDQDFDGDLNMVTSQKEFLDGIYDGPPITYEKKKAEKKIVIEDELWKTDLLSFDSKIGYITNCSTTMYSMLPQFLDEESEEYKEIYHRLKLCRRYQGDAIDKSKGIEISEFPKNWSNWNKCANDLDKRILIDKRPYFMVHLYQNYSSEYRRMKKNFSQYCASKLGIGIDQLLSKTQFDNKESEVLQSYIRLTPLLDSNCLMNNMCHYLESKIKELRLNKSKLSDETITILKDKLIGVDREKLKELYGIYKKYKSEKRYFAKLKDDNSEDKYKTIEQYNKYVRLECMKISSNIAELTNYAVDICYLMHPSDNKNFLWNIFGDGVVLNVEKNKQEHIFIPVLDNVGSVEFLGKHYSRKEIQIEESLDAYDL